MFGLFKSSGPSVQRIAAAEAVARAKKGEIVVIDVRDVSELRASGKAKDALHIPLMLLKTRADPSSPECDKRLSVDKPVALYCASGARSQAAGNMMLQMGYKEVFNIGGLRDWHAGGGLVNPA
ncbi:MAG: sulfurtransferase [Paracoccaceae bacterium]|nr:sulfurtransferase [Paracoccaceae bacterium]